MQQSEHGGEPLHVPALGGEDASPDDLGELHIRDRCARAGGDPDGPVAQDEVVDLVQHDSLSDDLVGQDGLSGFGENGAEFVRDRVERDLFDGDVALTVLERDLGHGSSMRAREAGVNWQIRPTFDPLTAFRGLRPKALPPRC